VICRVYIDGSLQQTDESDSSPFSWTWDTQGWANGTHVITVTATDQSDQTGSDSVTVTLDNTLATAGRLLVSVQVPTSAGGNWHVGTANKARRCIIVPGPVLKAPPADLTSTRGVWKASTAGGPLVYNLSVGYSSPGTSTNWDSFTVVSPYRSFLVPGGAASMRVALYAQPTVAWGYWENPDYALIQQIIPLPTGGFCCLALGEHYALLRGPGLAAWEVLDSVTTVRAAAAVNGKVLLAADALLLATDMDAGDLTLSIALLGETSVDAICSDLADTAYVAASDGEGDAALYSFTYPTPRKLADLPAPAQTLAYTSAGILAGCSDGHLYLISTAGSVTDLLDTEQTYITRLFEGGQYLWAGTGSAGKLFRSSATGWVLDQTFTAPTCVQALAAYGGAMWAAGDGNALWRAEAEWTEWATGETEDDPLYGVSAIHDAYSPGDRLYLAAKHTGGARLYSLQVAEATGWHCTALPPDLVAKVLFYTS